MMCNLKKILIVCSLGVVCATVAMAQQSAAGLPSTKGVYYRTGNNWVNLKWSLLWPYGQEEVKSFLSLSKAQTAAEIPGAHSMMQVADGQPVFFVKGLASAMGPKLVQLSTKNDYRRIKMRRNSLFEPQSPFFEKDARDVEIAQVAPDVVSIRPTAALTPGEYAVVTTAGPDQRRMMLSFDFRVGGTARP